MKNFLAKLKNYQIAISVLAICLLTLFFWYLNEINAEAVNTNAATDSSQQLTDTDSEATTESTTAPQYSSEQAAFYQQLKEILTNTAADIEGEIGITYLDLSTNSKISVNGSQEFVGASTTKVPLVMLISDQVVAGNLQWAQSLTYQENDFETGTGSIQNDIQEKYSIAQLAEVAITNSDNIAKNMLYDALGGSEAGINQWYQTYLGKSGNSENLISSDDAATILAYLYQNQSTNAGYQTLIKNMTNTIYDDRLVTDTTSGKVAHKIGSNESYQHDIGIFFNDHPYILTIYTNTDDIDAARDLISSLSDTVWNLTESEYPGE